MKNKKLTLCGVILILLLLMFDLLTFFKSNIFTPKSTILINIYADETVNNLTETINRYEEKLPFKNTNDCQKVYDRLRKQLVYYAKNIDKKNLSLFYFYCYTNLYREMSYREGDFVTTAFDDLCIEALYQLVNIYDDDAQKALIHIRKHYANDAGPSLIIKSLVNKKEKQLGIKKLTALEAFKIYYN